MYNYNNYNFFLSKSAGSPLPISLYKVLVNVDLFLIYSHEKSNLNLLDANNQVF
jgi:hypothetical protein